MSAKSILEAMGWFKFLLMLYGVAVLLATPERTGEGPLGFSWFAAIAGAVILVVYLLVERYLKKKAETEVS